MQSYIAESTEAGGRRLSFVDAILEIARFIYKLPRMVNKEEIETFIDILIRTKALGKKVLVIGAGRSGLVGRAFALRLLHMGFQVFVYGDTIVPAINKGDLVIAISGSGLTASVVLAAKTAKKVGAKVVAVTSHRHSPLGRIADFVVFVPGRTKIAKEHDYYVRQILGQHEPLTPLGTLFEISAMVLLDSVVTELMRRLELTEEEMRARHANIE
ncbi:MAG: 6-phospho-3-hexuloisomerase [Thermoprotei archaeon]|nr:MAG: 6-phospho-3-hexuloisomerase [Thermoprotei archaeon]